VVERDVQGGPRRRSVEILVVDTGPGLPARVRENLFVPFVTTKEGGTGLGLAISQRIVSAAGGRIEAVAGAAGTTFIVSLPVVEDAAEPDAPHPPRLRADAVAKPTISSEIVSAPTPSE
jgi:nitrogen-specific signal transduction histidine kinase